MNQDPNQPVCVQHAQGPGDRPAAGEGVANQEAKRQGGHDGSRGYEGHEGEVVVEQGKGAEPYFGRGMLVFFSWSCGVRPKGGNF